MDLEKRWMETEAEIIKLGSVYYLNLRGERLGRRFKTLKEVKEYCRENHVKSARYFNGGEFRRIVDC
jgi:hypothetical protein